MSNVTNLYGQPVKVGDYIVLTTTHQKMVRTRFAKVHRIEGGRTFVVLTRKAYSWDGAWRVGGVKPYIKEVFGVGESVPAIENLIPLDVFAALNYKG